MYPEFSIFVRAPALGWRLGMGPPKLVLHFRCGAVVLEGHKEKALVSS
jgi:hypothetical protein